MDKPNVHTGTPKEIAEKVMANMATKSQAMKQATIYELREEVIRAMGKMTDLTAALCRVAEAVKALPAEDIQRIDAEVQQSRAIQAQRAQTDA
jgi:hypothetical protein